MFHSNVKLSEGKSTTHSNFSIAMLVYQGVWYPRSFCHQNKRTRGADEWFVTTKTTSDIRAHPILLASAFSSSVPSKSWGWWVCKSRSSLGMVDFPILERRRPKNIKPTSRLKFFFCTCGQANTTHVISGNYNISLAWIKAIWDDFPYSPIFQWGRSEIVLIYPDVMEISSTKWHPTSVTCLSLNTALDFAVLILAMTWHWEFPWLKTQVSTLQKCKYEL